MIEAFVLDASAILCLLKAEPGADQVLAVLPRAVISAVNLSEVYAKLADAGGAERQIVQALGALHLGIEIFDEEQAKDAGMLRSATRSLGLSLGDRACLALARRRRATAVTADRVWSNLPADLGLAVRIVR